MAQRKFLDIPTGSGIAAAIVFVLIFMGLAFCLYMGAEKEPKEFAVKVADLLLQGAIVSLLFAVLKGIIDVMRPAA
jgi:hypothetical protein